MLCSNSRSMVGLINEGQKKERIGEQTRETIIFKMNRHKSRNNKNAEENEKMESDGTEVVRSPINTWGLSWGGRPVPLGSLVILSTFNNSR